MYHPLLLAFAGPRRFTGRTGESLPPAMGVLRAVLALGTAQSHGWFAAEIAAIGGCSIHGVS